MLITLLQRTPVLQVATTAETYVLESPVGAVLRSVVASVASLGALHSLAGATTQLVANVNQPAKATVGKSFSEAVTITGLGVSFAQSWSVGNTLPPGIAAQGAVLQGGKWVVNPSNGTLVLSGTPTAAGTYNISISGYQYTNLTGPVTNATAQIVVAAAANAAPVFTSQPASVSTIAGGNATFTVNFTGTPTPAVQWLKNGAAIAGANSATLALSNVTAADAAIYSAQLTNSLGSVTSATATLTVSPAPAAPAFTTLPVAQAVTVGGTVTFSVAVSGVPTPTLQWLKDGSGIDGATGTTLTLTNVQTTDAGAYAVTASNSSGNVTSAAATLTVNLVAGLPVVSAPPQSQTVAPGAAVTLTAIATGNPVPALQWQFDGSNLAGATSATLTLPNFQPANAGIYTELSTNAFGTTPSDPAILGVTTTDKVIGAGSVVGSNIKHPNGNIFDQVLVTGAATTITADPGKVTRTSFLDISDDIVQVEFSGAGTLSLVLDNPTGPATPVNYYQPTVTYMKGNAGIVITGADDTTNVSVFTVGRATAYDPTGGFNILLPISATNNPANNGSSLFQGHSTTAYDGFAGLAFIAISSTNGKFGGVRASNGSFYATKGLTGVYAPGVQFQGPVFVGNINAFDAATPVIMIGSSPDTRITGGDLSQPNGQPVKVSGLTQLKFTAGSDSSGTLLSAKANRATLQQSGTDVTAQIVVNPSSP
jgi:hypothetical protein